ncbi:RTX-I toxin determinant A from serotypes 1/9 [Gemmata obscuriglobus]|uniref:Calcium-binding protein n=1 Tax=Gemmata obscuriglobus TaxID=114 RepID=A0A2Z3GX42_9BACT|nr:calcium-binding protein [Gemmata obscuriglobus]AWM35976.1 calcium-binding protein [Gemmata obscuriglobus]QEG31460.1 RTX-I toxin determinant A from serotypes 1/9 [Gemmata obscuriglobus]VTS10802.1 hemolysin-type calcium-binding region : Hemolysin-type calcium-binding region OS=Paracoccus denitrificans (strain Pd 1222) GN=Pden_2124 PE=4 SV=1: HemolysinCabind: HemolysinCabind: HemolysinCabind: HemolysinCabind: HemolysinCabind: HemolysinCabind: HemolysinCabind: HemolysinCabind: HemolysinCabind [Ge
MTSWLKNFLAPTSPAPCRARLGVETLSSRLTPAGVSLSGTTLLIEGTAGDDRVDVVPNYLGGIDVTVTLAGDGPVLYRYDIGETTAIRFGGYDGNDYISNLSWNKLTAYGGRGDDTLRGGYVADELIGGEGNDFIRGYTGNDFVNGDGGNDTIYTDEGDDTVYGGDGNDIVYAGAGNDKVYGGAGRDSVYAGAGNDIVYGDYDPAAHYVYVDDEEGYRYKPTIVLTSNAEDTLYGEDGEDRLQGGDGNDKLYGGNGNDTLGATWMAVEWGPEYQYDGSYVGRPVTIKSDEGESGDDYLSGGAGNDTLRGGDGSDTLSGGDGSDWLYAGWVWGSLDGDKDYLYGDAGYDHFLEVEARDKTDWNFEHISALPG